MMHQSLGNQKLDPGGGTEVSIILAPVISDRTDVGLVKCGLSAQPPVYGGEEKTKQEK